MKRDEHPINRSLQHLLTTPRFREVFRDLKLAVQPDLRLMQKMTELVSADQDIARFLQTRTRRMARDLKRDRVNIVPRIRHEFAAHAALFFLFGLLDGMYLFRPPEHKEESGEKESQ